MTNALTALLLAGCGAGGTASPSPSPPPRAPAFSEQDVAFAAGMSMHLSQANTIADAAGARLSDPTARLLQATMRTADADAVDTIAGWLAAWAARGAEIPHAPELGDATLPGLVPVSSIEALRATRGDRSRRFLAVVVAHHRAALPLIDAEIRRGTDAQALALARRLRDRYDRELRETRPPSATPTDRPSAPR